MSSFRRTQYVVRKSGTRSSPPPARIQFWINPRIALSAWNVKFYFQFLCAVFHPFGYIHCLRTSLAAVENLAYLIQTPRVWWACYVADDRQTSQLIIHSVRKQWTSNTHTRAQSTWYSLDYDMAFAFAVNRRKPICNTSSVGLFTSKAIGRCFDVQSFDCSSVFCTRNRFFLILSPTLIELQPTRAAEMTATNER